MKSVIIFMLLLPLAFASPGKVLLFPKESDSSYVTVTSLKSMNLQSFTLCMRVATELGNHREMILFDYHLQEFHDLSVWQERNGTFSFRIGGSSDGVSFSLPQLSTFQTHLCVTWESNNGLGTFWMDGKHSISKVYKANYKILPGGTIVLGQDHPECNPKHSFVGEITDVNMWDRVLSEEEIQHLYEKYWLTHPGNVINWIDVELRITGEVIVHHI